MNWEKLFIFWLLAFPFIVWGQSYEAPKIIWYLSGSFLLTLLWLIKYRHKFESIISRADLFYFLWFFILLISSLFGVHPLESIIGGSYRHQGVLFFLALWLIGKTISILSKQSKALIIKGISVSVIIEGLFLISQKLFGFGLLEGRPMGTFGEPNAVAGFLAIGSYFISRDLLLGIPFLAIIISGSRSALISFLAEIFRFIKNKHWKLLIPLVLVAALVSIYVFSKAAVLRTETSDFESRRVIYSGAINSIIKKPILGYGAESLEVVYDSYFKSLNIPIEGLMIDRAHNIVLDVVIWSGILGLIAFTGWFILKTKNVFKHRWIAVASWLIFAMFQPLGVVHWLLLVLVFDL